MAFMIEKKYINQDMNIELTSYIDNKQNVWFRGKDVAEILGYSDTKQAIKKHVADKYKMLFPYRPGEGGGGGEGGRKDPLGPMVHFHQ